ncbi:nucleoside triphosphate hydrolase [Actibacterium mucosum KCTC 23349]|uniref:Nucleoside triphosphate hydrolase n=1 Tax=Actibacterium mucosum KCTC 23349 TaxID=1454373 RepID=A0A037ZGN7_9RHOB|nr:DUF4167 domain-containing protein [Actibacterium mucosum]KAJ55625.1 nucleoside triphosphate hydrolase [Actibacterium mucosum KCTC 23349]
MRSSKSRSRSKNNRSRSVGNIVNRVFDSSGPEGKVRGTPQQIIDKYNQLARDATLSNDRVAAENFQQHAEHYARLLGEAQREQEARREQQEAQNRERQQQQQQQREQREQQQAEQKPAEPAPQPEAEVIALDTAGEEPADSLVVETPENKPAPRRRAPRKKTTAAASEAPKTVEEPSETPNDTPAAE